MVVRKLPLVLRVVAPYLRATGQMRGGLMDAIAAAALANVVVVAHYLSWQPESLMSEGQLEGVGLRALPEFVRMQTIIDPMNTLFEGDGLTDNDMIGYLGGKIDENNTLRAQPDANTLKQFLDSPDLGAAFQDPVIASDENFRTTSEQILGSTSIQKAILDPLAREFYNRHGRGEAA